MLSLNAHQMNIKRLLRFFLVSLSFPSYIFSLDSRYEKLPKQFFPTPEQKTRMP